MLEKLLSRMGTEEKKQMLAEEYGMVMTTGMERRTQTMCNLSQNIIEEGMELHLIKQIRIKVGKGKTVSQIAEELEETVEQIEAMIERINRAPDRLPREDGK